MIVYKITDWTAQTQNNTQWGSNVTHESSGVGELCGPGWLHAYEHPLLAVLHNPIHGQFDSVRIWVAKAEGVIKREGQMKLGCTKLTTLRLINVPFVTIEQRVKYAILCALEVCNETRFVEWANKWLSGEDRSEIAAGIEQEEVLRDHENWAVIRATRAAMCAVKHSRYIVVGTEIEAAYAAEEATTIAQKSGKQIDLIALTKKAMED